MTDLYARYTRLKFDRPHERVLRITMENGRMTTTDEALHRELGEIWPAVDRDASVNASSVVFMRPFSIVMRRTFGCGRSNLSRV